MSSDFQNILYEERGRVARITINRPPLNILDIPTIKEINRALNKVKENESISIIVLAGAGDQAFSAGVDIKDHTPDKIHEMLRNFHKIFHNLLALERVTIAAVNGYCLGGGCELAAFCDIVVATEEAQFGQPEINVGCYPPVAAALLTHLIGSRRALELILTGNPISAQEAKEMGLINRVVSKEQLEAAVENFIKMLTEKSPIVLKLTKRALLKGQPNLLETLKGIEKIYIGQLIKTEDVKEGVNAFLEKRKPVWTGK